MKLRPVGLSRRGFLAGLASAIAAVAIPISDSFAAPLLRGARSGGVGGNITPSLVVEYMDTSGVLQRTTVVDGVTSITINQYRMVHFDASGTRSAVATTLHEAFNATGSNQIGYLIDYGEALGTNWSTDGRSMDRDTGMPIFGRVFTTTGSKTVRLRCKDSAGNEATISLTVVVNALGSATNIASGGGGWPAFASNTHYTLNRGSDYSSYGTLNLDGLHNVTISATGSGADPIVSRVQPDSRNIVATAVTRTRGCSLVNIDATVFGWNAVGFQYFTIVNGRARRLSRGVPAFYYNDVSADTATKRDNCKYPRGMAFWNCGEIGSSSDDSYVLIGFGFRRWHFAGVTLNKDLGTTSQAAFRAGGEQCTLRHVISKGTVASSNLLRVQAGTIDLITGAPMTWDADDDRVGRSDGSGTYGYPATQMVFHHFQVGASGETLPLGACTMNPQNNDHPWDDELVQYSGFEDGVSFADPMQVDVDPNVNFGGAYLSLRNCRQQSGTGPYFTQTTSNNPNNIPSGYDGPYYYETASTRPVPTPF